jgi:hypothetical protein
MANNRFHLSRGGAWPAGATGCGDLLALMKSEIARWGQVIRDNNIRPEK